MRIEPNIFQLVSYFLRLSDKGIKYELSLGSYLELSLTDPKWDPVLKKEAGHNITVNAVLVAIVCLNIIETRFQ